MDLLFSNKNAAWFENAAEFEKYVWTALNFSGNLLNFSVRVEYHKSSCEVFVLELLFIPGVSKFQVQVFLHPNFLSWSSPSYRIICNIDGLYPVVMDSILLSVWGRQYLSVWAANFWAQELGYGRSYRDSINRNALFLYIKSGFRALV